MELQTKRFKYAQKYWLREGKNKEPHTAPRKVHDDNSQPHVNAKLKKANQNIRPPEKHRSVSAIAAIVRINLIK